MHYKNEIYDSSSVGTLSDPDVGDHGSPQCPVFGVTKQFHFAQSSTFAQARYICKPCSSSALFAFNFPCHY